MYKCFDDFGLEIHKRAPGDTDDGKSVMLFCAAPRSKYVNPETYDDVDLSPIAVDDRGGTVAVVDSAKYLGGILTTDGKGDVRDVANRIKKASSAFGALRKCFFEKSYFSLDAKRQVYKVCVVSVLLYGSETWVLTEEMFRGEWNGTAGI